jgi:cell division protein FtsL
MTRAQFAAFVFLALAVVASGVGAVYTKFQSRLLFVELQQVRAERDRQATEWGRLQLELATRGALGRVTRIAQERLDMRAPAPDQIVVVR